MNKSTVYCIASALAVTMTATPVLNVMADTTAPVQIQENEQIKSADDFIQKYLKVSIEKNKVTEYILITEATEDNYTLILEGKKVYDTLEEKLQEEIIETYQQELDDLKKENEEESKKDDKDPSKEKDVYALLVENAQSIKEELEKKEEEEDSKTNESTSLKEEKTTSTTVSTKETSTSTLETKDQSKVVVSKQPVQEDKVNTQSSIIVNQEEQVNVASQEEALIATTQTQNLAKSTDTTAQDFVNTYLTSEKGNVFATANALNYQKITKSMTQWLKLSSSQKNEVNQILKEKINMTYNDLLQKAQQYSMQNGLVAKNNSTSINTATNTNVTIFEWLCVVSLGFMTFIMKRLKKQD